MTVTATQINALLERLLQGKGWRAAGIHASLFLAACALLVSRRPDALFHAQFFAEDGHVWFADAYNYGWFSALFRSHNGYYQTLPRLAAALSLFVPMTAAPLLLNLVALIFQALPASLLLSRRLSGLGSLGYRAALAFFYLALPNSREMSISVTEAQWHLALIACLLVLAPIPHTIAWRVFDVLIYVLCGLTGPFCFLLFPIVIFVGWRRDRWTSIPAGIFAATGLFQVHALWITDVAARGRGAPLGATWQMFVRILAGHIYLGTLLGSNFLALKARLVFLIPVAIGGTAVLVYAWSLSKTGFRLFLVFAALIFAGSLHSPMTDDPNAASAWRLLAGALGIRYWFFPTLAFVWSLVLCAAEIPRGRLWRFPCWGLLVLLSCIAVPHDWSCPAYVDLRFEEYVNSLAQAAPGTRLVVPENPDGWTLTLVKH